MGFFVFFQDGERGERLRHLLSRYALVEVHDSPREGDVLVYSGRVEGGKVYIPGPVELSMFSAVLIEGEGLPDVPNPVAVCGDLLRTLEESISSGERLDFERLRENGCTVRGEFTLIEDLRKHEIEGVREMGVEVQGMDEKRIARLVGKGILTPEEGRMALVGKRFVEGTGVELGRGLAKFEFPIELGGENFGVVILAEGEVDLSIGSISVSNIRVSPKSPKVETFPIEGETVRCGGGFTAVGTSDGIDVYDSTMKRIWSFPGNFVDFALEGETLYVLDRDGEIVLFDLLEGVQTGSVETEGRVSRICIVDGIVLSGLDGVFVYRKGDLPLLEYSIGISGLVDCFSNGIVVGRGEEITIVRDGEVTGKMWNGDLVWDVACGEEGVLISSGKRLKLVDWNLREIDSVSLPSEVEEMDVGGKTVAVLMKNGDLIFFKISNGLKLLGVRLDGVESVSSCGGEVVGLGERGLFRILVPSGRASPG